jgi:hypothetical protein
MKEKFKELQEKYPNISSAMVFSKLVKDRKMPRSEIAKWFKKLVNPDDYDEMDKKELRVFYYKLSNGLK